MHLTCHIPTSQHPHGYAHPINNTQMGPSHQSHVFVSNIKKESSWSNAPRFTTKTSNLNLNRPLIVVIHCIHHLLLTVMFLACPLYLKQLALPCPTCHWQSHLSLHHSLFPPCGVAPTSLKNAVSIGYWSVTKRVWHTMVGLLSSTREYWIS
jgi:hypothetical protein